MRKEGVHGRRGDAGKNDFSLPDNLVAWNGRTIRSNPLAEGPSSMILRDIVSSESIGEKIKMLPTDMAILSPIWDLFAELKEVNIAHSATIKEAILRVIEKSVKHLREAGLLRSKVDREDIEVVVQYLAGFAQVRHIFNAVEGLDYAPYHSSRVQQHVGLIFASDVLAIPHHQARLIEHGDFGRDILFVPKGEEVPKDWRRLSQCRGFVAYWMRAEAGAALHDIGKIGLSERLLSKPGKLTDEDYNRLKRHVEIGSNILDNMMRHSRVSRTARLGIISLVECHHLWYDGKGYTTDEHRGASGQDIPLSARIISVADAMDAMTAPRLYFEEDAHGDRKGKGWTEVFEELERNSRTQFDPEIVKAVLEIGRTNIEVLDQIKLYRGPANAKIDEMQEALRWM